MIPYLIILTVPLFIGFITYNKTIEVVENEVVKGHMSLLERSRDTLDRRLSELDFIMQQLAWDPKIIQFQYLTRPFHGPTTYKVVETNKSLPNYGLSNNFMLDYYIFFKNSEVVMSANAVYSFAEFYKNVLRYEGVSYERWHGDMMGNPASHEFLAARDAMYFGKPYSLVTYVQPIGYPGHTPGMLAVLIDNREIQEMLKGIDISAGGWAYIADERGRIISSVASPGARPLLPAEIGLTAPSGVLNEVIDAQEMLVTYTTSSFNGWTYVAAQPNHIVMEKANYIQKITAAVVLSSLVLGILIAVLLAYRNSKPIRTILNTITERSGGESQHARDAFRFIHETVASLMDNNRELQEELKQQLPFLREAFFARLLKGEFVSSKEIETLSRHVGIAWHGRHYAVAVLHLRGYDDVSVGGALEELDVKRLVAKEVLRLQLGDNGYVHDVSESHIALIFAARSGDIGQARNALRSFIERSREELNREYPMSSAFAVGGLHESLMDVARSYEESRQALHYRSGGAGDGVVWFDRLPRESGGYYYPPDVELRLMNLVKAGESAEAEKLLVELHRINFTERHLPISMQSLFVGELWGTVMKLLEQSALDDAVLTAQVKAAIGHVGSFEELAGMYPSLTEAIRRICSGVNERKKSHNRRLLEEVLRLLQTSYAESDLGLSRAADQLNVTEVYLSQFFKEQTGENFSDYLEKLRMERAKQLLLETGLSINDIAGRVGYNSANTFCRAFKRFNGLSATVYRRSSS